MDAAKVSVFLLDKDQSVRANEVGSVHMIRDYALSNGIDHNLYDLQTQFRCAGSESYIRWIDYVLGLSPNRSLGWKRQQEYEVRIFDDIRELESSLLARRLQGYTARMVAGFAWPWSDPREDGSLVRDVVIGDWARPWNKKPREMWRRGRGSAVKPEKHPYTVWANEESGFDQIGCIYSAQGFEFDYVGVIFCRDLRWDALTRSWIADLQQNHDPGFKRGLASRPRVSLDKLRHIYRVLSTRGMKGTFFYFLDEATARHFERMGAEA